MANPFANRTPPLSGPATDIMPVTPDDTAEMPHIALALYIEGGGVVSFVTLYGEPGRSAWPISRSFLWPVAR